MNNSSMKITGAILASIKVTTWTNFICFFNIGAMKQQPADHFDWTIGANSVQEVISKGQPDCHGAINAEQTSQYSDH